MTTDKILIVEDEADIRDVLTYTLSREGFRVLSTGNGREALRIARQEAPRLMLLDLMLPGLDGLEVCRTMREDRVTRDIPIIMLTAKGEESDVVLGLGLGADDYVTKPFSPKELVARARAVIRRGALRDAEQVQARLVFPDLVIDPIRHEVLVGSEPVAFTPTELRLLHLLASHPGRVFTRGQLVSRVIGESAFVVSRNIDVHVRGVRSKLGNHRRLIETVRGVGYRFQDRRPGR